MGLILILLVDLILHHLHCDINEVLVVFSPYSPYSWPYPPPPLLSVGGSEVLLL